MTDVCLMTGAGEPRCRHRHRAGRRARCSRSSRPSRSACRARWPARCSTPAGVRGDRPGAGRPRRARRRSRSACSRCAVAGSAVRRNAGLIVALRRARGRRRAVLLLLRGRAHAGRAGAADRVHRAGRRRRAGMWLRHGQRPGPVTLVGAGVAALGPRARARPALRRRPQRRRRAVGARLRWSARATYFVISADEGNGLPPMALAAGGLVVGAVALGLLGLVGLMPMRHRDRPRHLRRTPRSRGGCRCCVLGW